MNCHDWFQCWRENYRQSQRVKTIIDLLPHTTRTHNTGPRVLMVHIWILFTRHNRGDGERKETFKNKLLHFNFVTFLWPGKPWQKLHVFLRETGQKKHRCTWKQVQTPFSPVDLYASDHFGNAYPKELSSATNHLCWRRLYLTAVVAVVTFVESAITWLGPGSGGDGARRSVRASAPAAFVRCLLFKYISLVFIRP